MLIKSLTKKLSKIIILSKNTIILLIMLLVIFILSGGIYVVFTNPFPPSAITIGQRVIFVIPSSLATMLGVEQTSSETVAVMFFIILGVLGALMIDKSATFIYDSKTAQIWVIVGIILVSISILGLMFLSNLKTARVY
jgi:hypothetical protein